MSKIHSNVTIYDGDNITQYDMTGDPAKELARLKTVNKDLSTDLSRLSKEVGVLKAENAELTWQTKAFQKQFNTSEEAIKSLREERDRLRSLYKTSLEQRVPATKLNVEIDNLEDEITHLREERDGYKENDRNLSLNLDRANKKLSQVKDAHASTRATLKQLFEDGCRNCGCCPVCGGEPGDPPFAGYDRGMVNHKRGCRLEDAGKDPSDA
jgi:chromosome segregation ATPase